MGNSECSITSCFFLVGNVCLPNDSVNGEWAIVNVLSPSCFFLVGNVYLPNDSANGEWAIVNVLSPLVSFLLEMFIYRMILSMVNGQ
jgi:hypothetical protein